MAIRPLRPDQERVAFVPLVPAGPRKVVRRAAKASLVLIDLVAIAAAMGIAYRLRTTLPGSVEPYAPHRHFVLAMLSLPVWILLFAHAGLYQGRRVASRLDEFQRIVHAVFPSVLAMMVIGYLLKLDVSRAWIAVSLVVAIAVVTLEREVVRRVFTALRRRGRMLRPVVIVGANIEGLALGTMLTTDRSLGYSVSGFVDDVAEVGSTVGDDRPVLGRIADTKTAVATVRASGVIVASTAVDLEAVNRLARELSDAGIHVEMSSSLRDIAAERLTVRPLGRWPVMYVEPVRLVGWRGMAKRAFDLVVGTFLLVLVSPVILVAAIAVKRETRGPAFYRQVRVGRGGAPFRMLKLRTMVAGADAQVVDLAQRNEAPFPLFKMRDDPRITRVGRFLRRYSIDELPQLVNVLRGEMSMVGPRPALPKEMEFWSPELHKRLRLRPGVTGMWQVSGRSDCSFEEYMRWDLYYLDNWSLLTDLVIVLKTIPTVVFRSGAY